MAAASARQMAAKHPASLCVFCPCDRKESLRTLVIPDQTPAVSPSAWQELEAHTHVPLRCCRAGFPVSSAAARHRFYVYSNWCYQAGVFLSRSSGMLYQVGLVAVCGVSHGYGASQCTLGNALAWLSARHARRRGDGVTGQPATSCCACSLA